MCDGPGQVLLPHHLVGGGVDRHDAARHAGAQRAQAVAGFGQRVGRTHIAHAGVHPLGGVAERLVIPVGAATLAGEGEDGFVPVRGVQAAGLEVGHRTGRAFGGGAGGHEAAAARPRLRGPALLARVHRHRLLVDAQQRMAVAAVQDVVHAGLAAVHHGLLVLAAHADVGQHRRHHVVHVPDVVVDGLEVPLVGAGLGVHRHDGVGEQVLAAAGGAVLRRARARIAEGPVQRVQLGVDGGVDPGRGAAFEVAVAFPGVAADGAGRRRAEEVPHQVAVGGVDGQAGAAITVAGAHVDHLVVVHHGHLGDVAVALVLLFPHHLAGGLVQRDHVVAGGQRVHLAIAHGHAATRLAAAAGVVAPLDHAGLAVHRMHAALRGFDEQHAVDGHGGALRIAGLGAAFQAGHPGGAQLAHVGLVDLGQRRVVLVAQVAAHLRKVGGGGQAAVVGGRSQLGHGQQAGADQQPQGGIEGHRVLRGGWVDAEGRAQARPAGARDGLAPAAGPVRQASNRVGPPRAPVGSAGQGVSPACRLVGGGPRSGPARPGRRPAKPRWPARAPVRPRSRRSACRCARRRRHPRGP